MNNNSFQLLLFLKKCIQLFMTGRRPSKAAASTTAGDNSSQNRETTTTVMLTARMKIKNNPMDTKTVVHHETMINQKFTEVVAHHMVMLITTELQMGLALVRRSGSSNKETITIVINVVTVEIQTGILTSVATLAVSSFFLLF